MAKFYGPVGFVETVETRKGIWEEKITERNHRGDLLTNIRRLEADQSIHNDIALNNKISIVADPYAKQHFFAIRYVGWMGTLWTVTNVEVQSPRLILTLGGVYHGPTN